MAMTEWRKLLQRIDDYRWELPTTYKPGMRVPARVYADETLLDVVGEEQALDQAAPGDWGPGPREPALPRRARRPRREGPALALRRRTERRARERRALDGGAGLRLAG